MPDLGMMSSSSFLVTVWAVPCLVGKASVHTEKESINTFAITCEAALICVPGELGIRQGLVSSVFSQSVYLAQDSLQSSLVLAANRRSPQESGCFLWYSLRFSYRASSKMVGEPLSPWGSLIRVNCPLYPFTGSCCSKVNKE